MGRAAADRDRDTPQLERMSSDRLMKEVAMLTTKIQAAGPARLRRVRAFRILRKRDVPRVEIARVAAVTPGAVKNLIDALDEKEGRPPTEGAAAS